MRNLRPTYAVESERGRAAPATKREPMPRTFLIALLLVTGCVHARGPAPVHEVDPKPPLHIQPLVITSGGDDLTGLDGYDGDDLFRLGYEAYETGDYERSAALYARMLDEFPDHPDCVPATWNLALASEKMGALDDAAEGYEDYAALAEPTSDLDAALARIRAATLLHHLGEFARSSQPLALAAGSEELEVQERWEIRVLEAMVRASEGEFDDAESELNRIRREIKRTSLRANELYPYQSAMVWYQAGKLYRMRAEAVVLDDVDDLEQLDADLGEKAALLLEARQHLKRCLTHRIAAWSGPAALALGAVYEDFRRDLLAAPRPSDLDEEQSEVYDQVLADRTRQFLEKAVIDYRDVLRLAGTLRMEEAWIQTVQEALDRCERELDRGIAVNPPDPTPEGG